MEHRCYPWKWRHSSLSYANFLGTRSDIRMLTPTTRDELINDLCKAIDHHEGEFDVDYQTHLYMARRVEGYK